jgi:hypothetical protein
MIQPFAMRRVSLPTYYQAVGEKMLDKEEGK